MEQPVICVIVPVYKAEATLPRCIESVLTQQLSLIHISEPTRH